MYLSIFTLSLFLKPNFVNSSSHDGHSCYITKASRERGQKKTTNNNSCAGCAAHFYIEKCRPVS
jgi:hypothetical protein